MPRILILYGTTDGHTGKVADFLATELRRHEAIATVVLAGAAPVHPGDYDAVIVAASIQAGGYQRAVRDWVARHAAVLAQKPNAFLSVCLAILDPRPEARFELERIAGRFMASTGWTPRRSKFVAGALLYTRYGWLKRQLMRWMAGRAGGSTDMTRDHVYTDWADLGRFATEFAAAAGCPVEVASDEPAVAVPA